MENALSSIRDALNPSLVQAYDTCCLPYDFDNIPAQRNRGNTGARALLHTLEQSTDYSDVKTYLTVISGCDDHKELTVRIYAPVSIRKPAPAVLFLHGGGCIFGCCDSHPDYGFRFAKHAHCIVVAPEFRLAPEHPFPAALYDCYAALQWMASNPDIDPDRIAVCGPSGGGNLTAALALYARDHGGPKILLQMPLYPMLDCRGTESSRRIQDEKVWCNAYNMRTWPAYLPENPQEPIQYASPGLAEDLSRLPPAFTFIGTLDPFLSETMAYFERLTLSGVHSELHVYPGCFHGFELSAPQSDVSHHAIERTLSVLKQAFYP